MKARRIARPESLADEAERVMLGLVLLPEPGCHQQAVEQARGVPEVELGEGQGHWLPAVAEVLAGQDRLLLDQLERLPAVSLVQIVFAQIIAEEPS